MPDSDTGTLSHGVYLQASLTRFNYIQVKFQHKELLARREMLQAFVAKHDADGARRKSAEATLHKTLGPRRAKVAKLTLEKPQLEADIKRLQEELEEDIDNALVHQWPRVIQGKIDAIASSINDVRKESVILDRLTECYERHFDSTDKLPLCTVGKEASALHEPLNVTTVQHENDYLVDHPVSTIDPKTPSVTTAA